VTPEERAAAALKKLRAYGHDAHAHPISGRLAVWSHGSWWYVAGGDFERPSLIRAAEQPPGPSTGEHA
jgi:hypothetical protein